VAPVRGAAAMIRRDEPIQAMALGNMRQNGVRGCQAPMDIIFNFSKRKGSEKF
jgi:hypothetical protein